MGTWPAGRTIRAPQYLLITMRGGSTLQGSQLNQLRKQAGTVLRLVQTDGAGNYLMEAVRPMSAGALANLVTQLKNNPNVQDAAPATVGRKQVLAKPGGGFLVKGTNLMAGAGVRCPADTNATWRLLAGQSLTFTADSPDLSFTVPQNTATGNTGEAAPRRQRAPARRPVARAHSTGSVAVGGEPSCRIPMMAVAITWCSNSSAMKRMVACLVIVRTPHLFGWS